MKTTKLLSATILLAVVATTTAIANAEEITTPTPTQSAVETTPTPTATPVSTPTPTPTQKAQLSLTKEEWENGNYSNPYSDDESGHEPNAADLAGPGEGASIEEVNAWWMARVENCKTLTTDKEYIDCMWRPWVYGF